MPAEFDDVRSIGALLGLLMGRGVYAVEMLEREFPRFGFLYDRSKDELRHLDRSVVVRSMDPTTVARAMEATSGALDENLEPDARLVDAVAISKAVFRLLFPDRRPPGRRYTDRDRAYAVNVAAIGASRGRRMRTH